MAMRKNKYKPVARNVRCERCGAVLNTQHCLACDLRAGITREQRMIADAAANWLQMRAMTGQMSDQQNNRQRGDVA